MNRRIATAAVACAALVALAACGGGGEGGGFGGGFGTQPTEDAKTPEDEESPEDAEGGGSRSEDPRELHTAALDAMNAAHSLRYSGRVPEPDGTIDMDIHTDRDGNCAGEASIEGQGTFELLIEGKDVWLKPDLEFWMTHGGLPDEEMATALEGLYLYGTTDSPDMAEIATVCDLEEIFGGVTIPPREVTAGEDATHDGAPVFTLDVEERNGDTYTMLVSAEGEPYPLHMSGAYEEDTMLLEFSDYDVPVEITPPAKHLVLDLSEM